MQDELKLSNDQKQKLQKKLSDDIHETKDLLEKLKHLNGSERERTMQPFYDGLEAFLKETLTAEQFERFEQLKLQYDIPSIMLRPEIVARLNITDEQRRQFMGVIQGMQKEIEPLMKEAKSRGNPQDIFPEVAKLRLDSQRKIEAFLSDVQQKQWQEMTGKPFIIW